MVDSSDESQILTSIQNYIAAINNKDLSLIDDSIHTDSIVFFDTDIPPIMGKVNLFRYYEETFPVFDRNYVLNDYKITVSKSGDLAYGWLLIDSNIEGENAGRGLYLATWIKKDDKWCRSSFSGKTADKNWTW